MFEFDLDEGNLSFVKAYYPDGKRFYCSSAFDLSGVDLSSEITNALDDLNISGLTVDLQKNLQGAIDKAIGEAQVIFDKLKMLKN